RHTRFSRDWSSDVCSSDLTLQCRTQQLGQGIGMGTLKAVLLAQLLQGNQDKIPPDKDFIGSQPTVQQPLLHGIQHKSMKLRPIRSEERRVGKECRGRWVEE